MSTRLWVATVVGILAIGLLVAGCGDDGESEASTIPKAAFVKQGNAICEKRSKEISTKGLKVINEAGQEPAKAKAATVEVFSTILVPDLEDEVEEIRALGMPKGTEEQAERALDTIEETLDEANDDIERFTTIIDPFKKAAATADKAGLETCPMGV